MPKKTAQILDGVERLTAVIAGFDYRVEPDDFVLYELTRLIEEDRASLDDEEFRRLIDEGVREHVEENMHVRAELAGILRGAEHKLDTATRAVARRVVRALEDAESDLRNVGVVVRAYTAYLFARLQNLPESISDEDRGREWIARWRNGEIPNETLIAELQRIGLPAAAPAADLLFDAPEDRTTAETAIAVLAGVRSSVSARVLAHIVSEPMLEEDLEAKALAALRALWPLARHYMLYNLRSHTHEDLPYRWFQLFVEVDEIASVDLVLAELRAHGGNPTYREDISALVNLLLSSRDPEVEDKVMNLLNTAQTPPGVVSMLEHFLKEHTAPALDRKNNPWARQAQLAELNRKYNAAAKLFEAGRVPEALRALNEILAAEPEYPFALMLKPLVESSL